ncbi:peptide chain release factor N(5)-glutamine methyltransferase [Daejeonella sp.]|uniref:peptide chain release factor N(5)-glutamine methyltransferase n=1 Tax=Daejeonella sp. TaxID=2805397 RepID=UPI003983BC2E
MTIASIEKVFIEDLTSLYGLEEAGSIVWLVIGFVCKINRSQYLNNRNDQLSEDQLRTFYEILSQLKQAIPVQYVLCETEFYGSVFKVSPAVLIPRPETEELVDWILKDAKVNPTYYTGLRMLDIGTGSGCIPITLKKYLPDMEVSALDISSDALELAKENAGLNNTDVNFIQDDILNPFTELGKFSVISSNPPYVTLAEKAQMHINVLDHEPHLALFVPDDDPLIFYKAITRFAERHLEGGGLLYLEINENHGQETVSLLIDSGFKDIELRQDLRDRDRMIKARLR